MTMSSTPLSAPAATPATATAPSKALVQDEQSKSRASLLPQHRTLFERTKASVSEAAYRTAAEKVVTIAQTAATAALKRNGADDRTIAFITTFMASAYGAAFLSFSAGNLIHMTPMAASDRRVIKLADELCIQGAHVAMSELFDLVLKEVGPAIMEAVKGLPALDDESA